MVIRSFMLAAGLLAVSTPFLSGQAPGPLPGRLTASLGVGTGAATFSCDACASSREANVSVLARLGIELRPNLVLGAELTHWVKEAADDRGTATARVAFADLVLLAYPRRSSGLFLKAGTGFGWIRHEIRISELGTTTVTTRSPGIVLGGGWTIPVRALWALTPYADLNLALRSKPTVNGLRVADRLGANLLHVGVAVSLR